MRVFLLVEIIVLLGTIALNVSIVARNRKLLKQLQEAKARADAGPHSSSDPYIEFALIHMPADGKCPPGFAVAPDIFSRDGRSYAGCLRPQLGQGGAIDVLYPGETVDLHIPVFMHGGGPELPGVRQ